MKIVILEFVLQMRIRMFEIRYADAADKSFWFTLDEHIRFDSLNVSISVY